ncbi:hypothetical protein FN846DRAFT_889676 [Sphaerosporella brunnea]|uniref:Uncharacterized protein n=1 Tax=Sphaerosporella brunnea TaxID=1250544 RepID=A0A5J5EYI5_9PEZI|nr:hypothetical protein FN846DRAFT_889676 [Sphaerosporella brunnea]
MVAHPNVWRSRVHHLMLQDYVPLRREGSVAQTTRPLCHKTPRFIARPSTVRISNSSIAPIWTSPGLAGKADNCLPDYYRRRIVLVLIISITGIAISPRTQPWQAAPLFANESRVIFSEAHCGPPALGQRAERRHDTPPRLSRRIHTNRPLISGGVANTGTSRAQPKSSTCGFQNRRPVPIPRPSSESFWASEKYNQAHHLYVCSEENHYRQAVSYVDEKPAILRCGHQMANLHIGDASWLTSVEDASTHLAGKPVVSGHFASKEGGNHHIGGRNAVADDDNLDGDEGNEEWRGLSDDRSVDGDEGNEGWRGLSDDRSAEETKEESKEVDEENDQEDFEEKPEEVDEEESEEEESFFLWVSFWFS